jgi:hypothetical protein
MGKKTKRTDTPIDGVMYKQIQHTNKNDTWWKNIPQNPTGVIGSGLHIIDKNRENSHWEKYNGNKKIEGSEEYLSQPPKFRAVKIDLKNHGLFPAPSENHIAVLRGNNKQIGWISLEYYKKNKKKYSIEHGGEDNPDVVLELEE